MKDKTFDCVEMKRMVAQRIYQEIKDMTPAEEVAYWQEKHQEFLQAQKERRARLASEPTPSALPFRSGSL